MTTLEECILKKQKHGITQNEIAEKAGYSKDWVSMIFKGKATSKTAEEKIKTAIDEIIAEREAATDEANTEQIAEAPEDATIESPAELADGEEQNNGEV